MAEQNYTNDWKINITAYASSYEFYHLLISQVFVAHLFCSALLDQQYIVQRAKVSHAFNKEPESYRESLLTVRRAVRFENLVVMMGAYTRNELA